MGVKYGGLQPKMRDTEIKEVGPYRRILNVGDHINDNAIQLLTDFYREEIDDTLKQNNGRKVIVLDLWLPTNSYLFITVKI